MEDTVDKVAERLALLETTVARGFHENSTHFKRIDQRLNGIDGRLDGIDARLDRTDARLDGIDGRLDGIDARLDVLNHKMDVGFDSLRGDIKTVVALMTAHAEEMRRTSENIRNEHAADREVLKLALQDHATRLQHLEDWRRSAPATSSS